MNFEEKANALPKPVLASLISIDSLIELEKICLAYEIDLEEVKEISKEIGLIFVGDLKLADLPDIISRKLKTSTAISYGVAYEINKRVFNKFPDYFKDSTALLQQWEKLKTAPFVSENEAQKKILEAQPWILEAKKGNEAEARKATEEEERYAASLEKSLFNDALRRYPQFGEQLVTTERIKIPGFPESVRPSIKNWIADYTGMPSYERNNPMKRQEYLFKSTNARGLKPNNRERLSFVLKSFDENSEVTFNKRSLLLVFKELKAAPPAFSGPVAPAYQREETESAPGGDLHFSYPQKMSFEKTFSPTQPDRSIRPASPASATISSSDHNIVKIPPKTNPLPKNVVNLRNL